MARRAVLLNAQSPMCRSVRGSETYSSPVWEKHEFPISSRPSFSFATLRLRHSVNAPLSSCFNDLGAVKLSNPDSRNASCPISLSVSGNSVCLRLQHPRNASARIILS